MSKNNKSTGNLYLKPQLVICFFNKMHTDLRDKKIHTLWSVLGCGVHCSPPPSLLRNHSTPHQPAIREEVGSVMERRHNQLTTGLWVCMQMHIISGTSTGPLTIRPENSAVMKPWRKVKRHHKIPVSLQWSTVAACSRQ
ncbi:unnamed protein product [Ixodes pacificus]